MAASHEALSSASNLRRTVAEGMIPSKRLVIKVAYNLGPVDERVVIIVERGRPKGGEPR